MLTGILGERSDPMFYLLLYFYGHVQCTIFYPYPWIKHELQIRWWLLCSFHLLTLTFGKWSKLINCRCFFVRWKPPTSWLDSLMARDKFSWPLPRWFSKGILQNLMSHQMISLTKSPVQVQNPLNSDLGIRKSFPRIDPMGIHNYRWWLHHCCCLCFALYLGKLSNGLKPPLK